MSPCQVFSGLSWPPAGRLREVAGRRKIVLVAVAAGMGGLAILAWLNRPRDDPARATVGDAVRSFRAENEGRRDGGGPGEPALGVYRYTTHGSESAQNAILGGATHEYNGVSTIVRSAGKCGEVERWQVLAGRWTEGESCPGPAGAEFKAATEFHEFFGVGQEDSLRCRGVAMPGRPVERQGVRFTSICEAEDFSVTTASRVVGFEKVSIGGKPFPAIHIESRSHLEGESSGAARREEWRRRSDGLLLRRSAASSADTGRGGGTHYTEHYTIQLLDPEPRR
jgi:hypothetical protein